MFEDHVREVAHAGRAKGPRKVSGISHQHRNPAPNLAPAAGVSGPDTRRACPGVGGSRGGARFWVAQDVQNFGFFEACLCGASARPVRVFAKYANGVSVVIFAACSGRVFRSLVALARPNDQQLAVRDVEPRHGLFGQGNPGTRSWRRYGAHTASCMALYKRRCRVVGGSAIKLLSSVLRRRVVTAPICSNDCRTPRR